MATAEPISPISYFYLRFIRECFSIRYVKSALVANPQFIFIPGIDE